MLGQRERRLVAASKVLGLGAIAESAQVDDALDPLCSSHLRERRRSRALVRDEVTPPPPRPIA